MTNVKCAMHQVYAGSNVAASCALEIVLVLVPFSKILFEGLLFVEDEDYGGMFTVKSNWVPLIIHRG